MAVRLFALRVLLLVCLTGWLFVPAYASDALQGYAVADAQPNTPWDVEWQKVQVRLAARDDIALTYLTRGERGGETVLLHDLRRERAHLASLSLQELALVVPELYLPMSPYVFESQVEAEFVYDRFLFDLFAELFAKRGVHLIAWLELGWYGVAATKPVLHPDDTFDVRFAHQVNPAARLFLEATVKGDGYAVQNPGFFARVNGRVWPVFAHGHSAKRRVADTSLTHLTLTQHAFAAGALVANQHWFSGADTAQQSALRSAWLNPEPRAGAIRRMHRRAAADVEKAGLTVVRLEESDRDLWRKQAAGVLDKLVLDVGGRAGEVRAALLRGKRAFAERAR